MDRNIFDSEYRPRLMRLSTTNISDALDKLGIRGAIAGIRPLSNNERIVGMAVTIKITAAGMKKSTSHLGVEAIAAACRGDVIAIDNHGDTQNNCWGEVLSCAALMKGVAGVVVDGAVRDIDACRDMKFPVLARAVVPITARGRIMQESYNCLIRLGDVQVRPGDVIIGDTNGVVVIPPEQVAAVTQQAEALLEKEESMMRDLMNGMDILEVDRKYNYENMLK